MVGLGFREAEDRSSIQLESLFIVQVLLFPTAVHFRSESPR